MFHPFFLRATQKLNSFRYQRLGRHRLNPIFLKVGSTRAHARTVSRGIDLDGDAHILFPILLLIQIVLGTLMTVRPRATDIAVTGTIRRCMIWRQTHLRVYALLVRIYSPYWLPQRRNVTCAKSHSVASASRGDASLLHSCPNTHME